MNYDYMNGTSMSCPMVAGVAALILSRNPTYFPDKVLSIIEANVDPIKSELTGISRINAYKALIEYNNAPIQPDKPAGKTLGIAKTEYSFSTSSTDPDFEQIYYKFDWGDGYRSSWLGPYGSGDICGTTYKWSEKGSYEVTVVAKDAQGAESDWSESITVQIIKNKNRVTSKMVNSFLAKLYCLTRNLYLKNTMNFLFN
jgi:subtilisin family serine protease